MNIKIEISEEDIKEAVRKWVQDKLSDGMTVKEVDITVVRGHSDMRESAPDRVSAIAKLAATK